MYSVISAAVEGKGLVYHVSLAGLVPNRFALKCPNFLLILINLRIKITEKRYKTLAKTFLVFLKLTQKQKLAKIFISLFYSFFTKN